MSSGREARERRAPSARQAPPWQRQLDRWANLQLYFAAAGLAALVVILLVAPEPSGRRAVQAAVGGGPGALATRGGGTGDGDGADGAGGALALPSGITSVSNRWDACISGEALVLNLDASKPSLDEALAAVRACWAADEAVKAKRAAAAR